VAHERDKHSKMEQPSKQPTPFTPFEKTFKEHHFSEHPSADPRSGGRGGGRGNHQRGWRARVSQNPLPQADKKYYRCQVEKDCKN